MTVPAPGWHAATGALKAGAVQVDECEEENITMPFGGFKKSGSGRDRSQHAFDENAEIKATWIRVNAS